MNIWLSLSLRNVSAKANMLLRIDGNRVSAASASAASAVQSAGVWRVICIPVRGLRRVPVGEWHAGRGSRWRSPRGFGVRRRRRSRTRPASARHQAREIAVAVGLHEPWHYQPAAVTRRLQYVLDLIDFNFNVSCQIYSSYDKLDLNYISSLILFLY